jgi:hypothetical protein
MKTLPRSKKTLLVRTHFGDPAGWEAVCDEIQQPAAEYAAGFAVFAEINAMLGQDVGEGPRANVTIVDDVAFAGLTPEQLIGRLRPDSRQVLLLVVDQECVTKPDHPILVVDVFVRKGRTFRAAPSQVQAIENNLSIANCDWEDFADHVEADGVFRGLPG